MKLFKKDHYNKLMGVEAEPDESVSLEETAAIAYSNEADGNPVDQFTFGQKLLMRAAFLAGVAWARKNPKSK